MKKNDFYDLPKAGIIKRILWQCAGGDKFLLERATYSDQIKYLCLGGIVLATGMMAGLAGGYAFYTIFAPKTSEVVDKIKQVGVENTITTDPQTVILSIIFGIFWGLVIFNIDRFIVTSTGKGDGTEAITWDEFRGAIPRILMGAIIAITISKPVEIRMFKSEIDVELQQAQLEKEAQFREEVNLKFVDEINRKDQDIKLFEKRLNDMVERHKVLEQNYTEEARIVTVGPRAIALKAQMEKVEQDMMEVKSDPELLNLKKEKQRILDERDRALSHTEKVAAGLDGLVERIKLAHKVAGWEISLFITLLFMAIELTPVFFKLMLIKTPYDYLSDNRDNLIKANNGIEVKYDYYIDKKGMERHLVLNHDAEDLLYEKIKLSEIQKELTNYALEKYKQREKQKIDDNLDDYVKSI